MKKILFFLLGFTLIFSDSYKVIKVSDGDTITVMSLQQYNKFKVRLYGIDAPESDQSFGTQSKQFLSDQILNKEVEIEVKYKGYIKLQQAQVEKFKKLEAKLLPQDIDYSTIKGLRLEARQKLNKIKPNSVGQASRISGVSPADISVLLIYLEQTNRKV